MHAEKLAFEAPDELDDGEADDEEDEPDADDDPEELDVPEAAGVDFDPQPAAARATTAAAAAILVMLVVRTAPPPDPLREHSENTATMWTTVDSVCRRDLSVSQFSACGATSQYTCDPGNRDHFRHDHTTLPRYYGAQAILTGEGPEKDIKYQPVSIPDVRGARLPVKCCDLVAVRWPECCEPLLDPVH